MSSSVPYEPNEEFRDSVATVTKEGKRRWIFAQRPSGKFYNARTVVSIVYLVVFFLLPFIRVNGDPFFLFNVLERRFVFFGVTFWPQDFFIFGIGMLVFILFVVVFTVAFGRIFCGWACPQTVFMEMVFRRIEYWIEGDAQYQKQLDKMPWNTEKLLRRGGKHLLFFSMAFIIANTFLAYVIGTDDLFRIIREPVAQHVGGFISLLLFTGIFYAVYAWFREQVCLIVCPYGRLQGVMTDKDTINIAYDYVRGEPRAKFRKNATANTGDCIDCFQCVKVCPMGIDIRNGSQLECTNCTACIDACDFMMEKTGKPKGLIRYASENGIANKQRLRFTPRIIAYSAVLFALIGILAALLLTRRDVDTTILRTPGMLYQEQPGDRISNLYNIKLINKTHRGMPVTLRLESGEGFIRMVGKDIVLRPASENESSFFVFLPKGAIQQRKTTLHIRVYSNGELLQTVKTTFLGPTY
jgi:cytochrome c oxidase accessory protein FixG